MKTLKPFFKKASLWLLSGMIIFTLSNCKGEKEGKTSDDTKEDKLEREEIEKTVREVVYPLPTAFEVTNMINEIEASYIIGLTNNKENVDKYFTDKEQALNLGIYSADLSYASTYQMKQDVMNYMEASEYLIKELGITGAFDRSFIDKVEANINNKDKLIDLITNSFYDTYDYLVKNNKEDLSLLVLTGSWIEAMYISCNVSETVYNNPELVKIILHQKTSLKKLLDLLKKHEKHETINNLINQLKPIKKIYDSVDETGITQKQLNQIIEQTIELRTQITA
ncbi:MAG: hypothetical protein V2I54_10155 [Bacteroidales bacterium]|jgi:hypothetical protein|nr:hypothetical protein [Bacteroidales bacterium]